MTARECTKFEEVRFGRSRERAVAATASRRGTKTHTAPRRSRLTNTDRDSPTPDREKRIQPCTASAVRAMSARRPQLGPHVITSPSLLLARIATRCACEETGAAELARTCSRCGVHDGVRGQRCSLLAPTRAIFTSNKRHFAESAA